MCGLHVIYVMHIQGATWTKMETRKLTLLSHSLTAKTSVKWRHLLVELVSNLI